MYPSSTLCRTQEEFHRTRAAAATLDNVRTIATRAADAWGVEAAAAEKREARGLRTRAVAELMAVQKLEAAADAERQFSDAGSSPGLDRGQEEA